MGEEGVSIEKFNPDPYVQKWFELKVRRFNGAKPCENYPKKRKSTSGASSSQVTNIAAYTHSDLEDEESDND